MVENQFIAYTYIFQNIMRRRLTWIFQYRALNLSDR